jgi:hypothetical protein
MAHFAKLGLNSKVISVVVVADEDTSKDGVESEDIGVDFLLKLTGYPFWIQTSYNNNIRKNYAGIGFRYDEDRDAFIPLKPYSSWLLDEETCQWNPPTPYPGSEGEHWIWDEEFGDWIRLEEIPTGE